MPKKPPPVVKVRDLIDKETFDTKDDGTVISMAIHDSLANHNYAIVDFGGIKETSSVAAIEALHSFGSERLACQILFVHLDASTPEHCVHEHLKKFTHVPTVLGDKIRAKTKAKPK